MFPGSEMKEPELTIEEIAGVKLFARAKPDHNEGKIQIQIHGETKRFDLDHLCLSRVHVCINGWMKNTNTNRIKQAYICQDSLIQL